MYNYYGCDILNLTRDSWNKDNYRQFISYLFELQDIKYRNFHSGLIVGDNVIGIRTPILKDIAKKIAKGNYKDFLSLCSFKYYEELTLYGLIITNIKNLEESISYSDIFKEKIDNWASCDLFCAGYKIVKKNKEYFWNYINSNIISNNLWIRRLSFVLLLDYYIEEEYLNDIFNLCDKYNTDDYYVEMAVAWLISICYIKYPKVTLGYIKNNKLNNFTHNKAIQKIRESYRVPKEDKEILNKLKRK